VAISRPVAAAHRASNAGIFYGTQRKKHQLQVPTNKKKTIFFARFSVAAFYTTARAFTPIPPRCQPTHHGVIFFSPIIA
jgi:hypothetical protein